MKRNDYWCPMCGKNPETYDEAEAHIRKGHPDPLNELSTPDGFKWKCMGCSRQFLSLQGARRHMRMECGNEQGPPYRQWGRDALDCCDATPGYKESGKGRPHRQDCEYAQT